MIIMITINESSYSSKTLKRISFKTTFDIHSFTKVTNKIWPVRTRT